MVNTYLRSGEHDYWLIGIHSPCALTRITDLYRVNHTQPSARVMRHLFGLFVFCNWEGLEFLTDLWTVSKLSLGFGSLQQN